MKKLFFYFLTLLNFYALPMLAMGQGGGQMPGPGWGRGFWGRYMGWGGNRMFGKWIIIILLIVIIALLIKIVYKKNK